MSAGPGRVQRQVLRVLERSPEREVSRAELEEVFCEGEESVTPSNLLRAVRSLERTGHVWLLDVADKDRAVVRLHEDEKVSNERVGELLQEIGSRG